MTTVFAGDTPDFLFAITDPDGNQIDVTTDAVVNVIIVVYSKFDPSKVLGKYAYDNTGDWSDHDILAPDSGGVKLILPSEGTRRCVNEDIVAQITTILNTDGFPAPGQVITGADTICKIVSRVE